METGTPATVYSQIRPRVALAVDRAAQRLAHVRPDLNICAGGHQRQRDGSSRGAGEGL